jgi:hypothetical protein
MGSCSQNTLKNERLEHQSYRVDGERLSGETHSRVRKPGDPKCWSEGRKMYTRLPP